MRTIRGRCSSARGAEVLLVQPERDDRDTYAEYLSHRGLIPVCVQTADVALTLACRADIIVTGLLLPGALDGYMLIDRLRRHTSTRHTPIVVLTVCAWDTERERALRAGCDAFLSKPCLPQALFGEIFRLLAAPVETRNKIQSPVQYATGLGDTDTKV